jgi:hypothetical protein
VGVTVDAEGNVIVTGGFDGSIDLGCGPLTHTGVDGSVFVAKLDPSGVCLWSKGFSASESFDGGSSYGWASGEAVAVDTSNNIILAGQFTSSIVFGSNQLTNGGLFVAKLDPSGAPLWSTAFGVDQINQYGQTLAVDASGNVLVVGNLYGSVDVAGHHLTSPPEGSIFVAKLDPGGVPIWGKSFVGQDGLRPGGHGIAVDPSGNVLVTGAVDGDADFGCGAPLQGKLAFVAKLDPSGACVWSTGFSAAESYGNSVAATTSGEVVVTGSFSGPGTVDFGSGPVAGMAVHNLFVAKLDASGSTTWGKVFGVTGATSSYGITADPAGNVVVTGVAEGSVDFGCGTLTSLGFLGDVFVASFDGGGTLRWARLFGAPTVIDCQAIAVGPTRQVVVAGNFQGFLDFGGLPLFSGANGDIFVAELAP